MYRFELGAHPDVLEYFRAHFEEIRKQFRNEQAYLSDFLHKQGAPVLASPSGALSLALRHSELAHQLLERAVPEGARIVIFHGECNLPDALAGRRNRRFRFIKPARWVAEHWRE